MIIFKDDEAKRNFSCLCKEDGELDETGKRLYLGYGESKLRAFFDGHNKACRKLLSNINKIEFLSAAECTESPIGWIYKFEDGKWYVAETQNGEYKPLESLMQLETEVGITGIEQYLKTNYLETKDQIQLLKKIENSPIADCENMEEVEISIPDESWKVIDALCAEMNCTQEELIRYLLLSYVSDVYVGEKSPIVDIKG